MCVNKNVRSNSVNTLLFEQSWPLQEQASFIRANLPKKRTHQKMHIRRRFGVKLSHSLNIIALEPPYIVLSTSPLPHFYSHNGIFTAHDCAKSFSQGDLIRRSLSISKNSAPWGAGHEHEQAKEHVEILVPYLELPNFDEAAMKHS